MIRIFSKKNNRFTLHLLERKKGILLVYLKKSEGFTLLELLFVISIFTMAALAIFTIAQYPLFRTSISISRLTAAYLSKEGIEIVRNIRDENWLNGRLWNTGLGAGEYELDYDDSSLSIFSGRKLRFDGNYYNLDFGGETKFTRKITITPDIDEGADILKVVSEVSWNEKGNSYSFKVQENLYNWGNNF